MDKLRKGEELRPYDPPKLPTVELVVERGDPVESDTPTMAVFMMKVSGWQ